MQLTCAEPGTIDEQKSFWPLEILCPQFYLWLSCVFPNLYIGVLPWANIF